MDNSEVEFLTEGEVKDPSPTSQIRVRDELMACVEDIGMAAVLQQLAEVCRTRAVIEREEWDPVAVEVWENTGATLQGMVQRILAMGELRIPLQR